MTGSSSKKWAFLIACLSLGPLLGILPERAQGDTPSESSATIFKELDDAGFSFSNVDYSPNGTFLAASCTNGSIYIFETDTWSIPHIMNFARYQISDMKFNPNGTLLGFSTFDYRNWSGSIEFVSTDQWISIGRIWWSGMILDLEWSPDGTMISAADGDSVTIWNLSNLAPRVTISHVGCFATGWSPDGSRFAYGHCDFLGNSTIEVLNTTDWDVEETIDDLPSNPDTYGYCPSYIGWCSDGSILGFSNFTASFHGKNDTYSLPNGYYGYYDSEWGPFGMFFAAINTTNYGSYLIIINGSDADTVLQLNIRNKLDNGYYWYQTMYNDITWSPNGSYIAASSDERITIFHLELAEGTNVIVDLDRDDDGVDDDKDAFPNDPAASVDTDLDGYPDSWNPGKNASDSKTGLTIDLFPEDRTEWADKDNDGHGDNGDAFPSDPEEWSDKDNDGYGDNKDVFPDDPKEWIDKDNDSHGDNGDAFPDDPEEWSDQDSDGYGDNGDAFPTDPAASVDADKDGRPEAWNPGKSEKDSTTGLVLDLAAEKSTPLIKQGWFAILMIGLTILIVISITVVLFMAMGWKRNSSSSDEDGLIDGYRNEIISGKITVPSRKEVSEIVSDKVGNGAISSETGNYIEGLFPEE